MSGVVADDPVWTHDPRIVEGIAAELSGSDGEV
jgi:hypothetical protein